MYPNTQKYNVWLHFLFFWVSKSPPDSEVWPSTNFIFDYCFFEHCFFWTLLFMIIIFYTIGCNTYIHYTYYFNKIVRVYTYTKIQCLITLFIFLSFQIFARLRSPTVDQFYFRLLFFRLLFLLSLFLNIAFYDSQIYNRLTGITIEWFYFLIISFFWTLFF